MNIAGDFRYVAPGGFHEAELFSEYCEQDHGGNWDAAFEAWHEASQELKRTREAGFTSWLPMFNPIKVYHFCTPSTLTKLKKALVINDYGVANRVSCMTQKISKLNSFIVW